MSTYTMRAPLTPKSLVEQMGRLNAVFPKFGDADELTRAASAYFESLNDLDAEQLAGAVSLSLKNEQRFPVPAKIREHARSWTQANRPQLQPIARAEQEGEARLCPHCNARPRLAWVEVVKDRKTGEMHAIQRYLAACHPHQHPRGTGYVPTPDNFIRWVD
jgi:hypothetical protein